jgi:hypothetical protein
LTGSKSEGPTINQIDREFIPCIWDIPLMPGPRVPERRGHRQTYKNSDAQHDDHMATKSARIFQYLLGSAHKSTGVRFFHVYDHPAKAWLPREKNSAGSLYLRIVPV